MKPILVLSVLALIFLATSCNSGKSWEQVKEENTLEAYQTFLNANPDTEHKDSLVSFIMQHEWIRIKQDTSILALDSFKIKYPDNEIYKDSVKRLQVAIDWKIALEKHSIEAYEDFLKEYSSSSYKYSALGRIEEILWNDVKKANEKKKYIDFFAEYTLANYIDSVDFNLEFKDLKGYIVEFEGEGKDATGEIFEKIALNFSSDGKLTGTIEGSQEGQNYANSWDYEVRGEYNDSGFKTLESRFMGMSDEVDSQPDENWSELKMELDHEKMTILKDERIYKLKEISRID